MTGPVITPLDFTYRRPDANVAVLNRQDVPISATDAPEQQLIVVGPQTVAGNHRHPRREWFVALGPLTFVWQDEAGQLHREAMKPDQGLRLVAVPPLVPHAVVNETDQPVVLFELADAVMSDVEKLQLL